MTAHMHEVVDNCLAWQSRQHTVSHMSHYVVSSYTHHATPSTSATSSTFHVYRWCTKPTSSTGRCSGGLPAPHTAHCWDHCWSGAVEKKGTQEENAATAEGDY